ncbi:MAG: NAD(P)H-hydrate dehydratase [Pseudomonadota bacterium]|nr:NAD(P)H-hydrate dehydratase [Pseudomonadota bacterium]
MKPAPAVPGQIVTAAQMAQAERLTFEYGITPDMLIERAGVAVTDVVAERFTPQPVLVVCGPGRNGGDGFVAARHLQQRGWPVRVMVLQDPADGAPLAARQWAGPLEPADPHGIMDDLLVIDALFGAGLNRPLEGMAAELAGRMTRQRGPVVSVDMPSGIRADTGAVMGTAVEASLTVTFFRKKPAHVLAPGRFHAGEVVLVDAGIPDFVLPEIQPRVYENTPGLWLDRFPWPKPDGHKYDRGHVLVLGDGEMTGAARLAARAALRMGAGLVTVACPPEAIPVYASDMASLIVVPVPSPADLPAFLDSRKITAVLAGPGARPDERTRQMVQAVLRACAASRSVVLDGGALSAFADNVAALFTALSPRCVLTPHRGEYHRLSGLPLSGDSLSLARAGAVRSGATVVLKGPDTTVAAPDGLAVVNTGAPPDLATAGTGDVLAGMTASLLAQGVEPPMAGAMAVWMHGRAAADIGPGLVADDLPEMLPEVLRSLKFRDF